MQDLLDGAILINLVDAAVRQNRRKSQDMIHTQAVVGGEPSQLDPSVDAVADDAHATAIAMQRVSIVFREPGRHFIPRQTRPEADVDLVTLSRLEALPLQKRHVEHDGALATISEALAQVRMTLAPHRECRGLRLLKCAKPATSAVFGVATSSGTAAQSASWQRGFSFRAQDLPVPLGAAPVEPLFGKPSKRISSWPPTLSSKGACRCETFSVPWTASQRRATLLF